MSNDQYDPGHNYDDDFGERAELDPPLSLAEYNAEQIRIWQRQQDNPIELARVKMLEPWRQWRTGEIAGFAPNVAKLLCQEGMAERC